MKKTFSKIKAYWQGMTPAQKARAWTLIITAMTGIAGTGDKIVHVPFLPGWLANAWPVLVALDVAALKIISIFTNPNTPMAAAKPPVADSAPPDPAQK